jgi:hypothetical protein
MIIIGKMLYHSPGRSDMMTVDYFCSLSETLEETARALLASPGPATLAYLNRRLLTIAAEIRVLQDAHMSANMSFEMREIMMRHECLHWQEEIALRQAALAEGYTD